MSKNVAKACSYIWVRSLVAPDRLRFDFSHQKAISDEDMAIVEEMSNEIVRQSSPVETRLMAVDDAREMGAMALLKRSFIGCTQN